MKQFSRVSGALSARLSAADLAAIVDLLESGDRAALQAVQSDPIERARVMLHLGAHYRVPAVLEKTGLSAAAPPESIHSMGRGSLAAGGSMYYADLVIGALEQVGAELPPAAAILDFGCSSGRVIRVLKAYNAAYNCYGCDPNGEAIGWAQQNLPGIDFRISPLRPPLSYAPGHFDLLFAISIWSHMNQKSARGWLAEMRRIVKAGGLFLLTFHGLSSVSYYTTNRLHDPHLMQRMRGNLLRKGFSFFDRFGKSGDWGVRDSEWGEAYMSLRWLEENTKNDWQCLYYQAGLVEGNQDLAVLRAQ